jgi:sugar lactone lactonase YvrE
MGPDGFLYVGTLAFGANFGRFDPNAPPNWSTLPPQSKIYRVDPSKSEQFLTDADVWADGFNPITACAFGCDGLYVTEYATEQSQYATGDVVRVALDAEGNPGARTEYGTGSLYQPNGLALSARGNIFVSNYSISSGGGQVVRVNY